MSYTDVKNRILGANPEATAADALALLEDVLTIQIVGADSGGTLSALAVVPYDCDLIEAKIVAGDTKTWTTSNYVTLTLKEFSATATSVTIASHTTKTDESAPLALVANVAEALTLTATATSLTDGRTLRLDVTEAGTIATPDLGLTLRIRRRDA